jgi:hypothetical protein
MKEPYQQESINLMGEIMAQLAATHSQSSAVSPVSRGAACRAHKEMGAASGAPTGAQNGG